MSLIILMLLIPVFPVVVRGLVMGNFHQYASEVLNEEEKNSENGKMLTLTMAGFAFSGLFVLLVTNETFRSANINIEFSIYYATISAVALFASFSFESYKFTRLHEQICYGLEDTGIFALLASVFALINVSNISLVTKTFVIAVGILAWTIDFVYRVYIWFDYLSVKEKYEARDGE